MAITGWRWVALLLAIVLAAPAAAVAQQPSPGYEGAAALGIELRRLGTTKRVLMVGAHPDDENTQLLSALALGQGADVAYLSLTRGEGGQNGIGPELQEGLGLIRTEELLAARRLDGAQQYFTRAYDYGFSKSADEAFRHWPREALLQDVVAVIRHFRPDVVISVFSGTERDGHGQHQAAGILAREAFGAADDPSRFPELTQLGLKPFQPRRLMLALWRGGEGETIALPVGQMDPLLGRSHFQVAMASRGEHRSQDMAQPETPGPATVRLQWIEDSERRSQPPASIFAGIDTTLSQLAAAREPAVESALIGYEQQVAELLGRTSLLDPSPSVRPLAAGLATLTAAGEGIEDLQLRDAVEGEIADVRAALWQAAGLQLRAVADASAEAIAPGGQIPLELSFWNGGTQVVGLDGLEPRLPEGWRASPSEDEGEPGVHLPASVKPGDVVRVRYTVQVPEDAPITRPYFLEAPREGDLYRWDEGRKLGIPFEGPDVGVVAAVTLERVQLEVGRPAYAVSLDPRMGESRRPFRVVPAVSVALSPDAVVVPVRAGATAGAVAVRATLRAEAERGARGTFTLEVPAGWHVHPASVALDLPGRTAGGSGAPFHSARFEVTPPATFDGGVVEISGRFVGDDGALFEEGYTLIDYPHIQPRPLYTPATIPVHGVPVEVPAALTVGFVPGAGDHAPEALRQIGVRVEELSEETLASGDLGRFDAILTGIRAYEVNAALRTHNRRLLDYVEAGGTMVVQYNKYEYLEPGLAPFPVQMARPHGRVTDEAAPVRLLEPEHPALSWPNRITEEDFEGWHHERGLYFLSDWGGPFVPLLEMADPGEDPLPGSLLAAEYGNGMYVYSGLAFFRQLPEGVPGAYRLLVNLLSLGREP